MGLSIIGGQNPFYGELPIVHNLRKTNVYASCAINTMLHDGALKPFPCLQKFCDSEKVKTLLSLSDCVCTGWDEDIKFSQANGSVYWVENGVPYYASDEDFCQGNQCKVSIECPENAPSVSGGGGSGCEFDPRHYVYTYVNKDGFESPTSPASVGVCVNEGDCVTVSFTPSSDPCVTNVNIYRAQSGKKSGDEGRIQNTSGFIFAGQASNSSGSYTDCLSVGSTGQLSPITQDLESLPSSGVTDIDVTAFGVAVAKGRSLYISADGMQSVYQHDNEFKFDHKIIAIKYWTNSIYVFTERYVYRVDEQAAQGGSVYSNPPFRFEKILPIVDKFAIDVCSQGVMYISKSGVVLLSGNQMYVVTSQIYATNQWKSMLKKSAVRIKSYQQYLFIYSKDWDIVRVFEYEDGVYADIPNANQFRLPYNVYGMYINNDGDLLMSLSDGTYIFTEEECGFEDCGEYHKSLCAECCSYDYTIPLRDSIEISDIASGYLNIDPYFGDVTVQLIDYECDDHIVFEETFGGCAEHEFKFPSNYLSNKKYIRLFGCATVYELRLSSSAKLMGKNTN